MREGRSLAAVEAALAHRVPGRSRTLHLLSSPRGNACILEASDVLAALAVLGAKGSGVRAPEAPRMNTVTSTSSIYEWLRRAHR